MTYRPTCPSCECAELKPVRDRPNEMSCPCCHIVVIDWQPIDPPATSEEAA